jgi:iron complex outermembrane recepter protein
MPIFCGALVSASALALAAPVHARPDDDDQRREVTVVGERAAVEPATPASQVTLDAGRIAATVNATAVEDTLKYLPSLIVRKRNPGDTQAPLATRTNGVGASARSLIFADGVLLSALIGNNNTLASPRWGLVSPQEIARVDVLYGPFAAAYSGNSIGAVVNITTRLPDRLEATAEAAAAVQRFRQYGTEGVFPTYRFGATLGDRVGPLALFGSVERVESRAHPLNFAFVPRPAAASAAGTPALGGVDDLNRTGQPVRILGATAIPDQRQDRIKLKAALDLAPGTRLTYVGALFLNATDSRVESYVRDRTTGAPLFAGTLNLDGRAYPVPASAFANGLYRLDERLWSHALTLEGEQGPWSWRAVATSFDFDESEQRGPTGALPAGAAGGAGTITRLDGTGWITLDAQLAWRGGGHRLSAGVHGERYILSNDRFLTADWRTGAAGALDLRAGGRTRTAAVWAEDAWTTGDLTLTVGGRYEWWKAYRGVNFTRVPAINAVQPVREDARFSPKATAAWRLGPALTARLSYGEAWRFPTVAELYQVVTAPVPAVPNPDLRPEHARSAELALEHRDGRGTARLALFHEDVTDALLSQTGPLGGTAVLATFVQNVDRTRARGVEAVLDRRDVVRGVDLQASVTYTDATTRANVAFPASIGKRLLQVPRWKATAVTTWRPLPGVSLSAAGRYASRMFGTLDNSDVIGNTWQGFYQYLVVDLRATVQAGEHLTFGLGVDNLNDDRYFLFHPFPQRTIQADVRWRL